MHLFPENLTLFIYINGETGDIHIRVSGLVIYSETGNPTNKVQRIVPLSLPFLSSYFIPLLPKLFLCLKILQYWSTVLPLDVAKTIIQTNPDRKYTRNPLQVLNMVYQQAGIRGCYAGLGPTIARAFPANAAAIVTWEFAMKILGIKHH